MESGEYWVPTDQDGQILEIPGKLPHPEERQVAHHSDSTGPGEWRPRPQTCFQGQPTVPA